MSTQAVRKHRGMDVDAPIIPRQNVKAAATEFGVDYKELRKKVQLLQLKCRQCNVEYLPNSARELAEEMSK